MVCEMDFRALETHTHTGFLITVQSSEALSHQIIRGDEPHLSEGAPGGRRGGQGFPRRDLREAQAPSAVACRL